MLADPGPRRRRRVVGDLVDQTEAPGLFRRERAPAEAQVLRGAPSDALGQERSAAVVSGYLDILKVRPSARALNPLCYWLQDAVHGPHAAQALWTLLTTEHGTPEARAQVRDVLLQGGAIPENPAQLRLLAFVGDETARQQLEPILDGESPEQRLAVAEGFARAGHSRPLLDRVSSHEIFPYAVMAVELNARDLEGLRGLVRLHPTPENIALWEDAVSRVSERLDPESILEADDLLSPLTYVTPSLRSRVLGRVATLPQDRVTPQRRIDVIRRWVPLLLDLGEWRRAYDVLETIPPAAGNTAGNTTLGRMKFRAALMIGQYDVAGQLDGAPTSWIDVLAEIAPRNAQAATRLRDEIARRFNTQLTGEVKTAFDAAVERIPPPPTPAPAAGANGDAADQ